MSPLLILQSITAVFCLYMGFIWARSSTLNAMLKLTFLVLGVAHAWAIAVALGYVVRVTP